MIINVRESSMVRPAAETPSHSLWLSNMDLVAVNFHIRTVYFYRPTTCSGAVVNPAALREALSSVLVPFYPLAGRLKLNNVGRTEIDCNGEGVLFVVADTTATLNDLGDFAPSSHLLKLIPPIHCPADDISSFPLSVLQVTLFKCGGVAVGVGNHHRAIDGQSGLHFVNSWAKLAYSKGLLQHEHDHDHDLLKVKPILDRTLMRARDPPRPQFPHTEYQQPSSSSEPPTYGGEPELVVFSMFKLTLEQVNILKARLKEDECVKFSTYEAVASHVWRCTCIARGAKEDQETKLYIAVDGRRRLSNPSLPQGYVGNTIFSVVPTANAGDLMSNPPSYAATTIRAALQRIDDDYMRSAIDHLELLPDISTVARSGDFYRSPNLSITSLVGLPIHEADFGWGPPIYMGPAYVPFEGLAYLLPTQTPGTLSVAISLKHQHMELFKKLFYDMI